MFSTSATRRLVVAAVLVVIAALGAPALAQAQDPATLQGEELHQFGTAFNPQLFQVSGNCNPTGTSTFSFTVTDGAAIGPYPGVFDASGFGSFGPQILPPATQGFPGVTAVGQITDFTEYFTITSGDTTISGTKKLTEIAGNPFSEGACVQAPDGTTSWHFFANTTYDAVISTPTGQFSDSGLSYAETQPIYDQNQQVIASGFSEFFLLSNGVVPFNTTGQTTGGGQIDHVGTGTTPVTFGFNAYSTDQFIHGECNVVTDDTNVQCLDATTYSQAGNTATFSGNAEVNGTPSTYRIDVQDNAESGIGADTFTITTSSGFSATGVLTQGNIQVH